MRMIESQECDKVVDRGLFTAKHETALRGLENDAEAPALHRAAATRARASLLRTQSQRLLEAHRLYPKVLRLLQDNPAEDAEAQLCIGLSKDGTSKGIVTVWQARQILTHECEKELVRGKLHGGLGSDFAPESGPSKARLQAWQQTMLASPTSKTLMQAWFAALERVPGSECNSCGSSATVGALQRCGKCRGAWYCGASCQQAHWAHHKPHCRKRGAFLVADMVASDALPYSGIVPWELRRKVVGAGGEASWAAASPWSMETKIVPDAALVLDSRFVGLESPWQSTWAHKEL